MFQFKKKKNPLNFVPKGPINNKWSLVQVMAWPRSGDKPLPEPMVTLFKDASPGLSELVIL